MLTHVYIRPCGQQRTHVLESRAELPNGWSHRTYLAAEKASSDILQGWSIAIKDNMSVGGPPLTVGTFPHLTSQDGKYPISPIDASIVSRVLEVGANIIGTSTCENYSCTPLSYTSASGPVYNPWLFGRTVGGSGSGNAAMLSLGLAWKVGVLGLDNVGDSIELVLGGDQGGSVGVLASFAKWSHIPELFLVSSSLYRSQWFPLGFSE